MVASSKVKTKQIDSNTFTLSELNRVEKLIGNVSTWNGEQKIAIGKEYDVIIEYPEREFVIEEGVTIKSKDPIRLGYSGEDDLLVVLGWGIQVDLEEGTLLSKLIPRRFLEWISLAEQGEISDSDAMTLSEVCRTLDYRAFSASRRQPEYRQAYLANEHPCFLEFGYGNKVKIAPNVAKSLVLLKKNDYFGAWYTYDVEQRITGIKGVTLLPTLKDVSELEWVEGTPIEFDPDLESMLPDPKTWEFDESKD